MRVFHFILGKAAKGRANGVNQVIAGLAKYSRRAGLDVQVIGKAQSVTKEGDWVEQDGFSVRAWSHWSRELRKEVHTAVDWADVVHLHGTYAPHNIWLGRLCVQRGRPYVVTLHGGLAPERKAARGGLRKTLFHRLLQRRHLEAAAALHVLTEEEATDVLAVVTPRRLLCIPNGIDPEDFPPLLPRLPRPVNAPIRIGYIGRLSHEKNLQSLCEAFAVVNTCGRHQLLLAGPRSVEGDALAQRFTGKGMTLVGPLFGQDKFTFLRGLDVFVHPSLTDVFSIAAMESLACGVPTLITRTSNASYFVTTGGFEMCEPTAFGIERGLRRILAREPEWSEISARGRALIDQRLNWPAAVADLSAAYSALAAGGRG